MKTIKLNKEFYTKEAIYTVINSFNELAEFSITQTNDFFEISIINNKNPDLTCENILLEFANHCLVESK